MIRLRTVLLMSEQAGDQVWSQARKAGIDLDVTIVNEFDSLLCAFSTRQELLLSFGSGVIVPDQVLQTAGLVAINVHAASPDYPGRDPHHFAVYDGARQYGATMHYMTPRVDAGPIIDTELFDVPSDIQPCELLDLANVAGWVLINRFFKKYREHGAPIPLDNVEWGGRKSTRKMFQELCRIEPSMPEKEIERRYKATAMPGYRNLYIDLHGYRFRIERPER